MIYEEELKKARETGKGISAVFQEKSNYKNCTEKSFDCPHCGAYHGFKLDDNKDIIFEVPKETVSKTYELPKDIEWMCNHEGYSWHEDCKCSNCNEIYTQNNGC